MCIEEEKKRQQRNESRPTNVLKKLSHRIEHDSRFVKEWKPFHPKIKVTLWLWVKSRSTPLHRMTMVTSLLFLYFPAKRGIRKRFSWFDCFVLLFTCSDLFHSYSGNHVQDISTHLPSFKIDFEISIILSLLFEFPLTFILKAERKRRSIGRWYNVRTLPETFINIAVCVRLHMAE